MKELYSQAYFTANGYGVDHKRARMQTQEAGRIKRKISWNGYVLDVGCGVGDFLSNHFHTWRKYGVEISDYAADQARLRGVTVKPYEAAYDYEPETFDLVIFRGTIQHLDRPFEVLQTVTRLLRYDGLLAFLATPDAGGLVYRLWQDLPALDDRRNYWIPSAKTLSNTLVNLGYRDIEVIHPYRDTPYADPLRNGRDFLLRCLGVKRKFAFPGNAMEIFAWKR